MTKSKKIIFIVSALIVISMLFIPPLYGKGDDGSFYNVLLENGLYNQEGADTSYFNSVYGVSQNAESTFLPITLAKVLCGFVTTVVFDIRVLGALYLPLFLAGLYLVIRGIHIKNKIAETVICTVAAIILCDVGYFSYLNSLYYDALYICALILMAGAALNIKNEKGISLPCAILLAVASAIMAFYGVSGLIAGVLVGVFLPLGDFLRKNIKAETLICGVLIVVISAGCFLAAPKGESSEVKLYGRVIDGALYNTDTPSEDLEALGIDPSYETFRGLSYYDALKGEGVLNPGFKAELKKVDESDVLLFYIKNPSRFINVLSDAGKNAPFLTQSYIKTQSNSDYFIKKAPSIWSFCRRFLTPASFPILLLVSAVVLLWSVILLKKDSKIALAGILLSVSNMVFFVATILSGGLMGISRNLILHQLTFDMMIIIILVYAVNLAIEKRQELQDKYGVNQ